MEQYKGIIETYLKFFECNLLEELNGDADLIFYSDVYNSRKSFEKNVRYCLREMMLSNLHLNNKNDIVFLYGEIIKVLRRKIMKEISVLVEGEVKELFYLLAAYQAEFHMRLAQDYSEDKIPRRTGHEMESGILKVLNGRKHSTAVNTVCATHKNSLQLLTQICFSVETFGTERINYEKFINLFSCALNVSELIETRWMVKGELIKNAVVDIKDECMKLEGDYFVDFESFMNKAQKDMKNYEINFPQDVRKIIEKNFYREYGFKIETLERVIHYMPEICSSDSLVMAFKYEDLIEGYKIASGCSNDEAVKMLEFLCIEHRADSIKELIPPMKDDNRIFEKCIVRAGELYLYSHVLVIYACDILKRKLAFNTLDRCRKVNSNIIEKRVKNAFEVETAKYVAKFFGKVMSDVHKLDNGKTLSNQTDVIFYNDGCLYIVECKDISFQYTPYGFIGDLGETKEFLNKMEKRKKSILDNKDFFEKCFGGEINSTCTLVVYKCANIVTEVQRERQGTLFMSFSDFQRMIEEMADNKK